MTAKSVLAELKALGTAQNRKVYARHGVGSKTFGVSYANIGKLKKKIKEDHVLAQQLWKSGYHDARVLATMIADPAETSSATLDQWIQNLDNYVVTDAFSGLASRTAHAPAKMKKWMRSRDEWVGTAGWNLVTRSALRDGSDDEVFLASCLETIEAKIHKAKNRVRYSMNNALIAIGARSASLEKQAIAAAKRIGVVEVDHGETGCKTPDARAYIAKAKARKRARG
jgi:3-methyladenine DNA glycosylase AlkD